MGSRTTNTANTKETVSVGEAVVRQLIDDGVRLAFTVPGESFLPILIAAHDRAPQDFRVIATRHEGGAGFMAQAVGQLTGTPAACLVTRAVGVANAAIAIHAARQDSAPLVVLAGQVRTSWRGREAFQEVDLVESFGKLAKFAVEVRSAGDAAEAVHRACVAAVSGRPGPALVALPEDVLWEELTPRRPVAASSAAGPPTIEQATDVVRRILRAKDPVIVAGAGITRSSAGTALREFAERTGTPVVASWRRPDVFPNDHPLYLGMAGPGAPSSVLDRLRRADCLLAIGTRMSQMTTFGYQIPTSSATSIVVNVEAPLWMDADVNVAADARAFLDVCVRQLGATPSPDLPTRKRNAADRSEYQRLVGVAPSPSPDGLVHPYEAVRQLAARMDQVSVLTTDAGDFALWAARYLSIPERTRFLGPTSGAMGYAIPAAIGASLARPAGLAVALVGDGGAGMTLFELETAVREGANLLVIVFDNRMYGTIRTHQEARAPGKVVATTLGPVDFAAAARSLGATAFRAEHESELENVFDQALAAGGVRLVHLRCDPGTGRPA
jgi:acetolactate synthase-1/2/3 large subunit